MNIHTRKFNLGRRTGWLLALVLLLFAVRPALAQSEDGIKAAFIYNFAKFTVWPDTAFADRRAPITVGFVGADSLAGLFAKNVAGKTACGRDFAVKRFASAAGAETCQVVFVADATQAAAVLAAAKGKAILTVGDSDRFAAAGGMIRFVKDGAKISFDLDMASVNAAQLKLDAQLRQNAHAINGG